MTEMEMGRTQPILNFSEKPFKLQKQFSFLKKLYLEFDIINEGNLDVLMTA